MWLKHDSVSTAVEPPAYTEAKCRPLAEPHSTLLATIVFIEGLLAFHGSDACMDIDWVPVGLGCNALLFSSLLSTPRRMAVREPCHAARRGNCECEHGSHVCHPASAYKSPWSGCHRRHATRWEPQFNRGNRFAVE